MKKNIKNKNNNRQYSMLSVAFVCVLFAAIFMWSAITVHAADVPFQVSCTANATTINMGGQVTWTATAVGGSVSRPYIYTWSGDEGLLGSASAITKTYYTSGYKYAYLKVTSGSHDKRVVCAYPVYVRPLAPTNTCTGTTCGTTCTTCNTTCTTGHCTTPIATTTINNNITNNYSTTTINNNSNNTTVNNTTNTTTNNTTVTSNTNVNASGSTFYNSPISVSNPITTVQTTQNTTSNPTYYTNTQSTTPTTPTYYNSTQSSTPASFTNTVPYTSSVTTVNNTVASGGYTYYNTYSTTTPVTNQASFNNNVTNIINSGGNYVYQPPITPPVSQTTYTNYVAPVYYNNTAPVFAPAPIYYNNTAPVYYNNPTPVYYNNPAPVYNYQPISGTCYANTTYANVGTNVTWHVQPIGGTGNYTYVWTGSDGLYGSLQQVSINYTTGGIKTARVTVYSGNQSNIIYCNNSVSVSFPQIYTATQYPMVDYQDYPVNVSTYNYVNPGMNNSSGLDVACYADPENAVINQPVTWNVEVIGGVAPYRYSWTGSDGLVGTNSSIIKYYSTAGSKSAVVTVTSADGRTATRACSNSLTVRGQGTGVVNTNTGNNANNGSNNGANNNQATTTLNNNDLGASAVLSFGNVPWGWIAIIIILILFGTVLYLIFNRQKI